MVNTNDISPEVVQKAASIRRRISAVFEVRTQFLEKEAARKSRYNVEAASATGKDILETIRTFYANILEDEPVFMHFGDDFKEDLRTFLALRVYYTYEAWYVREDLTDEQIVAMASDLPENLADANLDPFRDPSRMVDFAQPWDEVYEYYRRVLMNLRAYAYVAAHRAKAVGSREAATAFMRLNGLLAKRLKSVPLGLEAEEVENMFKLLEEGHDALWMAIDYATMRPWDEVRAEARRQLEKAEREDESRTH